MFKIINTSDKNIIKFVTQSILTNGSYEFTKESNNINSLLVTQLLQLPFITRVFITANFIALQKIDLIDWADVQNELKTVIEDYFTQNENIFKVSTNIPVEVYAESTPNPDVMKFVTNKLITKNDTEFINKKAASDSTFIANLFDFDFVRSVFIAQNYISITKSLKSDWQQNIISKIRNYIKNNFELVEFKESEEEKINKKPTVLDATSKEIIAILDQYIKPAVMADGGNIIFDSYNAKNKTVKVILKGACSGCPSSTATLKNGIESTLKNLLPNKIETVMAM